MSVLVPEAELPVELSDFDAVEAAYPEELGRIYDALRRNLSVRVECDKELAPFLYTRIRDRLKQDEVRCIYLDGRPDPNAPQDAMQQGLIGTLIGQLRDVVRGAVGDRVVVLPHLDLLVSSGGGLTAEAREVIPLMYENPQILWLGFKDPSFPLPKVIDNLFPHNESLLGLARDRISHLVTQREARKFGHGLNPYLLYKHLSGVNAVRLRRLLSSLTGEDYPVDPGSALRQIRSATLIGKLSVPELDLDDDIGGYKKVKERLRKEIIDILAHKDTLASPEAVRRIESLIPRGMIFYGPPGTGKTLFAKALATALGAAVTVVSGPELKSKWVGESEENLRQIFIRARQSAPALIIFDELDSFAAARGMYTGSGVEHSMVNQLLTEMDGFRTEELVFVIGTTNFPESLDAALLRPGRFEFQLRIPFPDADDRRAIFAIYDRKLDLSMTDETLEYAVRRTRLYVEGTNSLYTGDHIQALCRAIARNRLREDREDETTTEDFDRAITEYIDRPELTASEERVVATHEAGHALVALHCPNSAPIDYISIQGDIGGALGYVMHDEHANKHVVSRNTLLDEICSLFGGREAEDLLIDDLSIGSMRDLERATATARVLVEELGMGSEEVGVERFAPDMHKPPDAERNLSDGTLSRIERGVREILDTQRSRARRILEENQSSLELLRDLLIEHKRIERKTLNQFLATPQTDGDA